MQSMRARMRADGRYIGTPNGMVLCVDGIGGGMMKGCLYHGYQKEGIAFYGYETIIRVAEELFFALDYPFQGTEDRAICRRAHRFSKKKGMERVLMDEELLEKHGDLGTFVVRVQHRQHSSWQGSVTWLEENRSEYFRSVLELIKIIDGVLDETEGRDVSTTEDSKNREGVVWQGMNYRN